MAVMIGRRPFFQVPRDAVRVHTDLEAHTSPAPRLERRVKELTRFGRTTFVLAGILLGAWAVLKLVTYLKFGGFHFGGLEVAIGVAIFLTVGAELWGRRRRHCLQGQLIPARVFIPEGKSMLELTPDEGEHRAANSLAGTMVRTTGVTVLKQVSVVYEIGAKTYVGQGPLASGELPACVDGGFKVICHPRWPGRAALLTSYDFEAAPGETE